MAYKSSQSKIVLLNELVKRRSFWRGSETVVWTNGCFDLLHPGHVRNLEEASLQGSILIVGINSDRSVKQLKGVSRPILEQNSRAEMLAALACVDFVTIFDDLTPIAAIEAVQPDVHCKGGDYAENQKPVPEREAVERYGGRLHFLKLHKGFSTTELIEKVRSA